MSTQMPSNTRKYIRFEPDNGDFVQVEKTTQEGDFKFEEAALLVDESAGGFSLVCLRSLGLTRGSIYRVKVGRMGPMEAELVWDKVLDDKVVRMGFRFKD